MVLYLFLHLYDITAVFGTASWSLFCVSTTVSTTDTTVAVILQFTFVTVSTIAAFLEILSHISSKWTSSSLFLHFYDSFYDRRVCSMSFFTLGHCFYDSIQKFLFTPLWLFVRNNVLPLTILFILLPIYYDRFYVSGPFCTTTIVSTTKVLW